MIIKINNIFLNILFFNQKNSLRCKIIRLIKIKKNKLKINNQKDKFQTVISKKIIKKNKYQKEVNKNHKVKKIRKTKIKIMMKTVMKITMKMMVKITMMTILEVY